MASAQDARNDQSIAESGFATFFRNLGEAIDEITADETDEDVLDALGELREALGKVVAAPLTTAEDVLHRDKIAMSEFALEIDEAIDMIAAAAAAGKVDLEMDRARKDREAIVDFTRTRQLNEVVEEMAAMGMDNGTFLPTGEVEEEAVDEEVFLEDQVQQEIYEEAFLEELDYHEMVSAIDDALDELREEAAGCKLSETVDAMASAQDAINYQSVGDGESGFAAFIRKLGKTVDEIAADGSHGSDEDVLSALDELSEALRKMLATPATAEVVLHRLYEIARGHFELEIDEAIYMITRAAANGDVDWGVRAARKAIKATEDFTRTRQLTQLDVEEMVAMRAANETVLATGEIEAEAVDGEVFLDDQAQQEMYEEAFLDELDYQEMVLAIDEALDELRQEAAGCSPDPPRTGYLGRYGFITLEDFLQLVDDAL